MGTSEPLPPELQFRGRRWGCDYLNLAHDADERTVSAVVLRRIGQADFRPDATLLAACELASGRVPLGATESALRTALERETAADIRRWSEGYFSHTPAQRRRTHDNLVKDSRGFIHLLEQLARLKPGLDVESPRGVTWESTTVGDEAQQLFEKTFLAGPQERAALRAEFRPRIQESRLEWIRAAHELQARLPALVALEPDLHKWVLHGGREFTDLQHWERRVGQVTEDSPGRQKALTWAWTLVAIGAVLSGLLRTALRETPSSRVSSPYGSARSSLSREPSIFRQAPVLVPEPPDSRPLTPDEQYDRAHLRKFFPDASPEELDGLVLQRRVSTPQTPEVTSSSNETSPDRPANALRPENLTVARSEAAESAKAFRSAELLTDLYTGRRSLVLPSGLEIPCDLDEPIRSGGGNYGERPKREGPISHRLNDEALALVKARLGNPKETRPVLLRMLLIRHEDDAGKPLSVPPGDN